MRTMFFMPKIILLLTVCMLFMPFSQAVEFDVQAEKVRWRYQEDAKDVGGAILASLPSMAEGHGGLLKLRLSSERDEDWFFGLSGALMDSTAWAEEAGVSSKNELSIKQQDIRVDMQYRLMDARFGIWLSDRQQSQERRNFMSNNVATSVADVVSATEIKSRWVGLSLTSVGGNVGQFEARIDAALALDVEVAGPLQSNAFSRKDGYRTGIHFRWSLPKQEVGVSGLNVTLRYEYQELGGEKNIAGNTWAYNRWQLASLGLLYTW